MDVQPQGRARRPWEREKLCPWREGGVTHPWVPGAPPEASLLGSVSAVNAPCPCGAHGPGHRTSARTLRAVSLLGGGACWGPWYWRLLSRGRREGALQLRVDGPGSEVRRERAESASSEAELSPEEKRVLERKLKKERKKEERKRLREAELGPEAPELAVPEDAADLAPAAHDD
ncbi:PREDICTED: uncharacterized protein C7orf50 homolog [Myotis brandtii]|uniref:uncharacterized protein C7orf50 homolog n=1 Tax=Myotis brandtii TaxID=109478 RepID=UPI00070443C0|nr:PREDICTED: uncharacterized protein C7orf50 homolog [Myotis brandtii]